MDIPVMLVSICGTPCSGKTASCQTLSDRGWNVINEKHLIEELSLFSETDRETGEIIVDIDILRDGLGRWEFDREEDTIVEGHLSYLAPCDLCLIIRLAPSDLRPRLERRGYSREKIQDNVGAEILGYVTTMAMVEEKNRISDAEEALPDEGRITFERDVTGLEPEDIGDWYLEVIDHFRGERFNHISMYRPGKIDWLEAYSEWF